MQIQNAYDYLRWEYARLDNKKRKYKSDDLNALFERNKERYGKDKNLYESDKLLFKKLEEISSSIV